MPGYRCDNGDKVSVGKYYEDDEEPDRFKWKIVKDDGLILTGYRIESIYCSHHKNRRGMVLGPRNLKCDEGQPITLTDKDNYWKDYNIRQKWVDNSGVDSVREFNVFGTCNQEITLSDDGNGLVLKKSTKIPIAGGGVSTYSLVSSKMLWIVSACLLICFCLIRFSSY